MSGVECGVVSCGLVCFAVSCCGLVCGVGLFHVVLVFRSFMMLRSFP